MTTPKSQREKTADYRKRQREKGLRLVQFWVPDTRSPEFLDRARRQSEEVNASHGAGEDIAFLDALVEELLQDLPEY